MSVSHWLHLQWEIFPLFTHRFPSEEIFPRNLVQWENLKFPTVTETVGKFPTVTKTVGNFPTVTKTVGNFPLLSVQWEIFCRINVVANRPGNGSDFLRVAIHLLPSAPPNPLVTRSPESNPSSTRGWSGW